MSNVAGCLEVEALLEAATGDTRETVCFFGVMRPSEEMAAGEEQIATRLTFQGDSKGVFHSMLDSPATSAIAANVLGEGAEDVSRSCLEAVACELANMICGSPDQAVRRVFELESGSIALAMDFRPKL
jgi:hypothetical protein